MPLRLYTWALLALLTAAEITTEARRPHIVLIIADDLGWNDVGVHGSQLVPTPHVDALAAAGRLLRRHYALPTCTPSRAALLAGRHAAATGMQGFPLRAGEPRGLPLREATLAEALRARSYATRLVGKWHVGAHRSAFLPTRRGFQSHFGYRNGYLGYFDHRIAQSGADGQIMSGLDLWRDDSPEGALRGRYLTHALTEEAVRLIREHARTQPERPLFLQLAHMAVHTGNDSTPFEVPDPAAAHRRFAYEPNAERRLYAEMVSQLDASVGEVVRALRDAAMLNDSLIIFLSDNGGMTRGLHYNTGSNWPLRGTKHTLFEGGVHTVGAVWSPRLRAQRTPYPHLLHISDWMPTLLAAADEGQAPSAAGREHAHEDVFAGVSHWQALSAPVAAKAAAPRRSVLLNVDDVIGHSGVLSGRWKYVEGSHEVRRRAGRALGRRGARGRLPGVRRRGHGARGAEARAGRGADGGGRPARARRRRHFLPRPPGHAGVAAVRRRLPLRPAPGPLRDARRLGRATPAAGGAARAAGPLPRAGGGAAQPARGPRGRPRAARRRLGAVAGRRARLLPRLRARCSARAALRCGSGHLRCQRHHRRRNRHRRPLAQHGSVSSVASPTIIAIRGR